MPCAEFNKGNKCALFHLTMTLITKANDVVSVLAFLFFFYSVSNSYTGGCIEKSRFIPSPLLVLETSQRARLLVITNLPYVISFDVFAITVNLPGRFATA